MPTAEKVFAAQYLRMSTDHQQYSLSNQSIAIQKYAEEHGFDVVATYSDAAKSGVLLKRRSGLQRLLADVVSGRVAFRVILVYDVSRWGRFQDADESAHYEFLCKSAGVPIHYCAEPFKNDDTIPSLVMKALKRAMASEYSRELGTKIFAGLRNLSQLGFKTGGPPGYGLRRMLVSPSRQAKQLLASGEYKSIATDRVILVPGPNEEVRVVREIFRMFAHEGCSIGSIAENLKAREIPYFRSGWCYQAVWNILRHPKYAGCAVFAKTTSRLYSPVKQLPKSQWVITPGAYQPLVDLETFGKAQDRLQGLTNHLSDDQFLDRLRRLLAEKGKLTIELVDDCPYTPSVSGYRWRFGSLWHACELIGYANPRLSRTMVLRQRTRAIRDELFAKIVGAYPGKVNVIRKNGRWRKRLQFANGMIASVLIAHSVKSKKNFVHWRASTHLGETDNPTLFVRLTENNSDVLDIRAFPRVRRIGAFRVYATDPWLAEGKSVRRLERLFTTLKKVAVR